MSCVPLHERRQSAQSCLQIQLRAKPPELPGSREWIFLQTGIYRLPSLWGRGQKGPRRSATVRGFGKRPWRVRWVCLQLRQVPKMERHPISIQIRGESFREPVETPLVTLIDTVDSLLPQLVDGSADRQVEGSSGDAEGHSRPGRSASGVSQKRPLMVTSKPATLKG
jgi:hypothetical protein